MEKVRAEFDITIWANCPACEQLVDVASVPDFWQDKPQNLNFIIDGLEVYCPECGHEFEVTIE
jgi:endogenous inhibitor of DNA gyrase (YacG/DUF329 family)